MIFIVLSYYFSILYSLNIIFLGSEISENLRLFFSLICGSTISYIFGLNFKNILFIKNSLKSYLIFLIITKILIFMFSGLENISFIYQSLYFLESLLYAFFFFMLYQRFKDSLLLIIPYFSIISTLTILAGLGTLIISNSSILIDLILFKSYSINSQINSIAFVNIFFLSLYLLNQKNYRRYKNHKNLRILLISSIFLSLLIIKSKTALVCFFFVLILSFLKYILNNDIYKLSFFITTLISIIILINLNFEFNLGTQYQKLFRSSNFTQTKYTLNETISSRLCLKSFNKINFLTLYPPVLSDKYNDINLNCKKLTNEESIINDPNNERKKPHSFLLNFIIDNGFIGTIEVISIFLLSINKIFLRPNLLIVILPSLIGLSILTEPFPLYSIYIAFLLIPAEKI